MAVFYAGEDVYAFEHFFYQQRGGVFLEMGALDGFTYSNTLMFEHYLDWCAPDAAATSC